MSNRAILAAAVLAALGWAGTATASGIPVVDVASINQQIIQIQHALTQIEQLKSQLETANKELAAMSGSRGLATVIDSVYDAGMEVDADRVRTREGLKSAADYGLDGTAADIFDGQNSNAAEWLAQSQAALRQSQQRFEALTGLIAKVNDSPDQKDVLDLQARINAENVMLQNESVKLAMMQSRAEARRTVEEQRIRQMGLESTGDLSDYSWE
jgi:type IV secretion system protein VirB5